MEAEKAIERDWSLLVSDALNLIAEALSEISDFVRFRAVCTAWRSSAPITDQPPQFPWILEYNSIMKFYSIPYAKFYTVRAPSSYNQHLLELTEGYLILEFWDQTQRTTRSFLFNPLNNHKIPLPKCDYYPIWLRQRHNQIREYGLCCELCHKNSNSELVLCRLGKDHWLELNKVGRFESESIHFYLKGMLFTLDINTGFTKVIDITMGNLSYVIPPVKGHNKNTICHILEASGDILGAFGCYNEHGDLLYKIYHLHVINNGSPCWVKVRNFGNRALFLDLDGGFVRKADDMAGIRANCIYYLNGKYVASHERLIRYEMVRMDMKTGRKEHHYLCPNAFKSGVRWFVPNLCHL